MNYIKRCFVIFAILTVGYFVLGELFLPADGPDNSYFCQEYNEGWRILEENNTWKKVEIPGNYSGTIHLEGTLPDRIPQNVSCICFRGPDMEIFVEGELRQSYSTAGTQLFGDCSPEAYVMASLQPEDAGKRISVEMKEDSGILYPVYLGNRIGIWLYLLSLYGGELIIAFLTLLLGIVCIIGSVLLGRQYNRSVGLGYLGCGVSFAAIWLITNSVFRQIICPSISVVSDVPFVTIAIMPLPFIIYMNEVQEHRFQKIYLWLGILNLLDFMVCVSLHVGNVRNFRDTFFVMASCCLFSILFIFITLIIDLKKGFICKYKMVAAGMLCAFVAAYIQIGSYFRRTGVFSGATVAMGLILLLVFSIINTLSDIIYMERAKREAVSASQAKGRFLANMSHEIRTPINAVLGMNEMILRESREENIREYASDIQMAGRNLLSLINDILDFSKIESGKMKLVPVEYDFSSTIHDIMNMITIKAEDKELYVRLKIDAALPSRLYGDDIRIRQIIINILNNAVKYTNEGGVTFSVGREVQGENVLLHVVVTDTGIGMKEEDLSKLFSEFERIEESRNRNVEGTGLGMNITKQLLEMMGSSLNVSSIYGQGSSFSFDLTQKIVNREPIGNLEQRIREQAQQYRYVSSFTAPEAKVLIVDDNKVNRKVFGHLVKALQLQVENAASGMECLEMVQNRCYDIIFLDHMMPEIDGIETLHRLKSLDGNLSAAAPVIALTANAVTGAREMYLAEGFDDFLTKPIVSEKLEHMLMKYLPKDKVERQVAAEGLIAGEKQADDEVLSRLEQISQIPEINLKYAQLFNKETYFLLELIRDFYHMLEPEAEALENFYDGLTEACNETLFPPDIAKISEITESLRQYRVKVHSMKSSAAMVGAVGLSGMAFCLEKAAREGKLDVIWYVTPSFLEEWRSYEDKLAVLDEDSAGEDDLIAEEDF